MKLNVVYDDDRVQAPYIKHHRNEKDEVIVEAMEFDSPFITYNIKNGNITITLATTRMCPKCGRKLPPKKFHKKKVSPTGRQSHCVDCVSDQKKDYYKKKKQKKIEDQRIEEYLKEKENEDE